MILIEGMTVDQAFKVLGINPSNYKKDDLKDIYRKAAIKNHPDKGGDVNVMTQINLAYELLKNSGGGSGSSIDWKTVKAETKKYMDERVKQEREAKG